MTDSEQPKYTNKLDSTDALTNRDLSDKRTAEVVFIEALRAGQQEAWARLVDEYTPRLYNYLKAQLPTAEAIDDVLSEIFLGVVQAIHTIDPNIALSTLLDAIAYRKVADYWRRQASTVEEPKPERTPLDGIEELSERDQLLLHLRYTLGRSMAEIAASLGMSQQEAEQAVFLARRTLMKRLEQGETTTTQSSATAQPRPLFSVLQLLYTQQQKCLTLNMRKEAEIFQRALHFLRQLIDFHPIYKVTSSR